MVYEHEFEILRAMDKEYVAKMNEELQAYQARETARQKAEAEAAKGLR